MIEVRETVSPLLKREHNTPNPSHTNVTVASLWDGPCPVSDCLYLIVEEVKVSCLSSSHSHVFASR